MSKAHERLPASRGKAGVIAVLGASGWIGAELLRHAPPGVSVVGFGRSAKDVSRWQGVSALAHLSATHSVSAVVNCIGTSVGSGEERRQTNETLAAEVGEACLDLDLRLLHIGSAAEYGPPPNAELISELAPVHPCTPYGRSKLAGTERLMALRARGLEVTVARAFNVVGPAQPLTTPIGEFAAAVRQLPVTGGNVFVRDSSLVRDFISTTLLARALLALAMCEQLPGIVNVCSGVGHSFAELIYAMADIRNIEISVIDTKPDGIARVVGDPALLRSLIGPQQPESVHELAAAALQREHHIRVSNVLGLA